MSKDIRNYFSVVSKKSANTTPSSVKRTNRIDSSDDEIVKENPLAKQKKHNVSNKKRKIQVIDSDSEDESLKFKKKQGSHEPKDLNQSLKPVNIADAFGNMPVKQKAVDNVERRIESDKNDDTNKSKPRKSKKLKTETHIHEDLAFEKTLLELDEDLLVSSVCDLDKTIEGALKDTKINNQCADHSNTQLDSNISCSSKTKRKIDDERTDIDQDQDRHEKKRHSAILYQKYLNRPAPLHHGNKEIPKGKPDSLKNLCFIKTGVLDSLESSEFENLIKEHGGRTVHAVSRKVNYIVVGDDPGPAKLEKASNYGIKTLSEDELLDLILIKSGLTAKYVKTDNGTSHSSAKNDERSTPSKKLKEENHQNQDVTQMSSTNDVEEVKPNIAKLNEYVPITKKKKKKQLDAAKDEHTSKKYVKTLNQSSKKSHLIKTEHKQIISSKDLDPIERPATEILENNLAWTEKYKPTDIKGIIGQQGDKSNMKKLLAWLQNWHKNHFGKNKPKLTKPSPWAKNDDGAYFKCALLSGPPGVGKTTTATLVSKELGFDIVEFNASDTRSKKLLHEEISQLLNTTSIASFIKDGSVPNKKHVLLMDEVDGMAGNEDRGGIQELISLIKTTNTPIICMCNDRNHPKVRSLVNYCLDLRFVKPRLEQIRGAMMSVCFKEGLKLSPDALSQVISGAGMDIRQILNHLSMWTAADKNLTSEVAQNEANNAKKDTIIGPWEVIRKVFSEEEHKNMSLVEKFRLFFYDYSIGPLFVQENYLQVIPHCSKTEVLERIANAADSISRSDIIDKKIRSTNNWSLLEMQALNASVLPGFYLEGHMGGQINFPGWLGKNSKKGKFQRLLSELQAHMRTCISANRVDVNLDYIYYLRDSIIRPLRQEGCEGVSKSLEIMHNYNLLREDFDSLVELTQWPRHKDPMAMIDSKVKAAFTRAYNKGNCMLPYAIPSAAVKKKNVGVSYEDESYEDGESAPESDDDDVEKDCMIKAKKKPVAKGKKGIQEGSTSKKVTNKAKGKKK